MSKNQAPVITQPSNFRPYESANVANIAEGKIVKVSGAFPGCDLATSPGDTFAGVTVEIMYPGVQQSVQVAGRTRILSGAAITRGDRLTTDAQGRAVPATANQSVIGWAETAVSGADEWVAVEMAQQHDSAGNVQLLELNVTHADLDAAATSQVINLGSALPANARVLGRELVLAEAFAGGTVSAMVVDIGGTDADGIVDGENIFTGAALNSRAGTSGINPTGTYGGQQLTATFVATGDDVHNLTAGDLTIRIFYAVAA